MDEMSHALQTAVTLEKNGYNLYMLAAKKTKNPLGKSTLEAIAKKELDHIKAIQEFAKNKTNSAIKMIGPKSKKDLIKPIMAKLKKELDKKITKESDLENAYKIAIGLEKSTYAFYMELMALSKEPKAKDFFGFLMNEEKTHYELLSETLQYLNKPGDWYREQEKWIEEG